MGSATLDWMEGGNRADSLARSPGLPKKSKNPMYHYRAITILPLKWYGQYHYISAKLIER